MESEVNQRALAVDLLARLPFTPNDQQLAVAAALARFCLPDYSGPTEERVFIFNGYAGTGKTSLTGALVQSLAARHIDTVLLAPTGRAAKVFGAYARRPASTIHRRIYRHSLPGSEGHAVPRENTARDTIFIVDEASMIGADDPDTGRSLLADLIHYVYTGERCRLILMGDTAQLPPVGQTASPAMQPEVLRGMGLKVTRVTLTDVARQSAVSGILYNATRLRRSLTLPPESDVPLVPLMAGGICGDVRVAPGDELPDILDNLYRNDGIDNTIVITRSNRSAVDFNRAIRGAVLGYEEEIVPGDLMIAARNNYFWSRGVKGLDFIANGEILRVVRLVGQEVKYGMRFADVEFALPGRDDISFTAKIILSCLISSAVGLEPDMSRDLFRAVYTDPMLHAADAGHAERIRAMQQSPYYNALQMKWAYAVTCHKAQGGQWRNVLVDLSYIPPEQVGRDFNRWLYTAVTRATDRLYLINPPEALMQ